MLLLMILLTKGAGGSANMALDDRVQVKVPPSPMCAKDSRCVAAANSSWVVVGASTAAR